MKISIIYVSQTGNTEAAADFIEDGILSRYPFIQVKKMDIGENEVDLEFLEASDAVIFGSPVYFTSMSWELKRWFDNSFRIPLSDKLGAAFVTAQSPTGGTDTALMEIIRHMLAKGMLVCSGKNGMFQIGAVGLAKNLEDSEKAFEDFGISIAEKVIQLKETKTC
ncbi:MAG: flavodoxin family protein [Ruminococcus sp.]|jgi:NAD(P)H dehydrogenase (quinone)